MRKPLKYGVIAAVAVVIIAAAIGGVAVLAQSPDGDGDAQPRPGHVFAHKVANALGLDQEQVANAFHQARQEMVDEAIEQRVEKALQEGVITDVEAAEILDWWEDRPEALQELPPRLLGPRRGR